MLNVIGRSIAGIQGANKVAIIILFADEAESIEEMRPGSSSATRGETVAHDNRDAPICLLKVLLSSLKQPR